VPLLMYSPLIKTSAELSQIASHADIAPTLLAIIGKHYQISIPEKVAWLGTGLLSKKENISKKEIPLLRSDNNIQDYILGSYFLTDGDVYSLGKDLSFTESSDENEIKSIKENFTYFKGVNNYVTAQDKILPKSASLITHLENEFNKEQEIWIQSVFNGKDFDQAYRTARKLAIDKDWERALLLCRYILSEIPRHADTEILMGRLNAWQEQYDKSIRILEKVIQKYPEYEDGYCALLDTYYWADQDEHVYRINESVKRYNLTQELLSKKITRSLKRAQEKRIVEVKEERQLDKNKLVKNNSK
ncbi:MAG: LTA synthase family protein, partial [Maribacter sp.]